MIAGRGFMTRKIANSFQATFAFHFYFHANAQCLLLSKIEFLVSKLQPSNAFQYLVFGTTVFTNSSLLMAWKVSTSSWSLNMFFPPARNINRPLLAQTTMRRNAKTQQGTPEMPTPVAPEEQHSSWGSKNSSMFILAFITRSTFLVREL